MAEHRLMGLRARNVGMISAVEVSLDGELVRVCGDADNGKTTLIQCVEAVLRGIDPEMVRRGADTAEIELELTSMRVKRIFDVIKGKDTVMASGADGKPIEKPEAYLRAVFGPLVFNPIEWANLGEVKGAGRTAALRLQRSQLLSAIPMELSTSEIERAVMELGEEYVEALTEVGLDELDLEQHPLEVCRAIGDAVYDYRKGENRAAEDAEREAEKWPAPAVAAPKGSVEEWRAREAAAREAFYQAKGKVDSRGELAKRRGELAAKVEEGKGLRPRAEVEAKLATGSALKAELDREIAEMEAALDEKRRKRAEVERGIQTVEGALRAIGAHEARVRDLEALDRELAGEGEVVDLEGLRVAMEDAIAARVNREAQDLHDGAMRTALAARERAELFTELVKLFRDVLPKKLLERAKMPYPGMSFDEEQVLVDGVPLYRKGTAERLRVAVCVAMALNPDVGFVTIDQGESLGKSGLAALARVAEELGVQLLMACVDPLAVPGEGTIVMQKGVALTV